MFKKVDMKSKKCAFLYVHSLLIDKPTPVELLLGKCFDPVSQALDCLVVKFLADTSWAKELLPLGHASCVLNGPVVLHHGVSFSVKVDL